MENTLINNIFSDTITEIEKAYKNNGITGIPTGFRDLDVITGGWKSTELIVVSAPVNMGKTALALSMMRNMALNHEIGVAYFSLYLSAQSLLKRMIANETNIPTEKIQKGTLINEELEKVKIKTEQLSNLPIYINDFSNLTVEEFRLECIQLHFDNNVKVFIIDYLELMASAQNFRFKQKHIAQTLASLKEIAMEYSITIIVLSQLTSEMKRKKQRLKGYPKLKHFLHKQETMNNIADKICFLYRFEYYGHDTDENGSNTKEMAKFIVAKSRNRNHLNDGITLRFCPEFHRFENWGFPLEK